MKTIKNIILLAGLSIAAGFLSSCAEEEFQPGPQAEGAQVYFPKDLSSITVSEGTASVAVPVMRAQTDGALTVSILSDVSRIEEASQSLFSFPSEVSFAAGESQAEYIIGLNGEIAEDVAYEIGLLINDENLTTPYGASTVYIDLIRPSSWVSLGMATYTDDFVPALFSAPVVSYEVELQENGSVPGRYRLVNPYGAGYPHNEDGDYDATSNYYMVVDATDPTGVYIEQFYSGMNWGYGEFVMWSMANYYMVRQGATVEDVKAQGLCGTLNNGVITFPEASLLVGMTEYQDGSLYPANNNGAFQIVFPGVVIADYSLSASYSGMKVASDNQTVSAIFDFTYGEDVNGISYAFAEGDITSAPGEVIAAIADGSLEAIYTVPGVTAGGGTATVEAQLEPGVYTLVALPADASGSLHAEDAAVHQFYFPGIGGTETPDCEIEVEMFWLSSVPEMSDIAASCPDWSSLGFTVYGSELSSLTYLMNTTDVIGSYDPSVWPELTATYGNAFGANELAFINENGAITSYFRSLSPGTSYTILVLATNIYGATGFAYATYSTDNVPYEGELVVGDYLMSCQPSEIDEPIQSIFSVQATEGSETEFLVRNLGIEDGTTWYATYDSAASTLTLDGTAVGYESNGNVFGRLYSYFDAERTMYYMWFSSASEDSEGNDPCVFTVDPTTHEINGLASLLEVVVFYESDDSFAGYYGYYDPTTTVSPYTAPQSAMGRSSKVSGKTRGISSLVPAEGTVRLTDMGKARNGGVKTLSDSISTQHEMISVR